MSNEKAWYEGIPVDFLPRHEIKRTSFAVKDAAFFEAGRALFTVSSPKRHITYRINKKHEPGRRPVFFASTLQGERKFKYLGLYNPAEHDVLLTRKSEFVQDSAEVKGIRFALARVSKHLPMPEGYEVRHEGRCGRCGKQLTEPVSIEAGFGPECRKEVRK